MNHSYTVIAYFIYLPIALLLTWYVARHSSAMVSFL